MAKSTIFDKLVKKDYSNKLEEILSEKMFKAEVKSLLLDILYKIDISYKDYQNVKKNVLSKDEYIENLLNVVKNNCDSIKFIKPDDKKQKSFSVNKKKKQIICYPIARKLLYSLAKIQKNNDIIKTEPEIINQAMTNMINIGNNINTVEPLRDFNGYSWNISVIDIESFYYNLIYQDLIILIGNTILEEWTNRYDGMIDYMELFSGYLERKYGKKSSKKLVELFKKISILMEMHINKEYKEMLIERKEKVEADLNIMENKADYLNRLTERKKEIEHEIRELDLTINDKQKLAQEYERRNEVLPLEEKIFSKRILTIELMQERDEKIQELKMHNKKMNAKNFVKRQKELKYEYKYLQLADTTELEKEILTQVLLLQKEVLQVIKIKIQNAKEREEFTKILYELRYFNLIPLTNTKNIENVGKIKRTLSNVKNEAIEKACDLKMITEVSKNKEINQKILQYIFSLNIISMEDIYYKIIKGKDEKYFIQFFDDNVEDERMQLNMEIDKKDLKIKLNKKIKLFI